MKKATSFPCETRLASILLRRKATTPITPLPLRSSARLKDLVSQIQRIRIFDYFMLDWCAIAYDWTIGKLLKAKTSTQLISMVEEDELQEHSKIAEFINKLKVHSLFICRQTRSNHSLIYAYLRRIRLVRCKLRRRRSSVSVV